MKSSTKDQVVGRFENLKGRVKELAGSLLGRPELKGKGTNQKAGGKAREKLGQVEKVVGK